MCIPHTETHVVLDSAVSHTPGRRLLQFTSVTTTLPGTERPSLVLIFVILSTWHQLARLREVAALFSPSTPLEEEPSDSRLDVNYDNLLFYNDVI